MKKILFCIDYALDILIIPLLFFLIFMLFSCCFPSYNVNAASIQIEPSNTYVNGSIVPHTYTNYFGGYYYMIEIAQSKSFNRITYEYDFSSYQDYEYVSFLAYFNDAATPVPNINSEVCQIVYSTENPSFGNTSRNSGWVGVTCNNPKKLSYIDFQFGELVGSAQGSRFYVTSSLNFYGADEVVQQISDLKDKVNEVNDSVNKVGDAVNDVNDTLNDGSVDSDQISSVGSNLPPTNGVVSSIINLPVRFFQSLLNALSTTTCLPIKFTIPIIDVPVSIPCLRNLLEQLNALEFYETIGALAGGILLFNYVIYMGKTFQKMENLESTNSSSWGGL